MEKFCYVISGRVRCSIGQEKHELKTGDTIDFNSGHTHQMENAGASSAKVLCVAVPENTVPSQMCQPRIS